MTNSIRALSLHLSGSLKIPIFSNRLSLHKHDISCEQHGASRCFCVTTKDTPASDVVLRASQALFYVEYPHVADAVIAARALSGKPDTKERG
jgi:hypothetical protein